MWLALVNPVPVDPLPVRGLLRNEGMEGKYKIELNWPGDGRLFVNWWDNYQGFDVCAEFKNGSLFLSTEEDNYYIEKDISFEEYLILVKGSIAARPTDWR